jgi:hypothetical protein
MPPDFAPGLEPKSIAFGKTKPFRILQTQISPGRKRGGQLQASVLQLLPARSPKPFSDRKKPAEFLFSATGHCFRSDKIAFFAHR